MSITVSVTLQVPVDAMLFTSHAKETVLSNLQNALIILLQDLTSSPFKTQKFSVNILKLILEKNTHSN